MAIGLRINGFIPGATSTCGMGQKQSILLPDELKYLSERTVCNQYRYQLSPTVHL